MSLLIPALAPPMTLAEMEPGARAVIEAVPGKELSRLRELGLLPGTEVELVRHAPLGDPIEISLGGALLSLRLREASLIRVRTDG